MIRFCVWAIGASARAIAHSCLKAGWDVVATDGFGDVDLRESCDFVGVNRMPYGLNRVVDSIASRVDACVFAGSIEHHPGLLRRIGQRIPVLGASAATLAALRDPFELNQRLVAEGFKLPRISRSIEAQENTTTDWLAKPFRSGGGAKIKRAPKGEAFKQARFFIQEWAAGDSFSATFIGAHEETALIGVTRQLVGEPWLFAQPFSYCGSVGPWPIGAAVREELVRLGKFVSSSYSLRGWFGVDFLMNDERVVVIEVNPRYTASMEIFERANSFCLAELHRAAIERRSIMQPRLPMDPSAIGQMFGKVIPFAPNDFVVSPRFGDWLRTLMSAADIPAPDSIVPAHGPIATLYASGSSFGDVILRLRASAIELYRELSIGESRAI